jgi:hypothetical protein
MVDPMMTIDVSPDQGMDGSFPSKDKIPVEVNKKPVLHARAPVLFPTDSSRPRFRVRHTFSSTLVKFHDARIDAYFSTGDKGI